MKSISVSAIWMIGKKGLAKPSVIGVELSDAGNRILLKTATVEGKDSVWFALTPDSAQVLASELDKCLLEIRRGS